MNKAVYTLRVNDYAPRICELTIPLMERYARKIGADFVVINGRRYPDWPVPVEKFQIGDIARELGAEWNLFFDADTLIHPECIDWTAYLSKDTVAQNGNDFSSVRHRLGPYHWRDGRNIGTCGWCTIASDWCLDLWDFPTDLTPQQAADECFLTTREMGFGMKPEHLVDDYLLSRNVARFGLKYAQLTDIMKRLFPPIESEREQLGEADGKKTVIRRKVSEPVMNFLFHVYTFTEAEKLDYIRKQLDRWNVPDSMLAGADLSWRSKTSGFDRLEQAEKVKVI